VKVYKDVDDWFAAEPKNECSICIFLNVAVWIKWFKILFPSSDLYRN